MEKLAARLQLKDFRLIHAIDRSGQLALAAEQLAITQPAASRMLATIEKAVGTRVFDRHPKGMTPTAVGQVLVRNAATLLQELDRAVHEVEEIRSGRAGSVRVGSVTGGAVAFVVPAIQKLKQEAVGADIHVDVAPSKALIEGLLRGDYDFVLSRIPPGVDARQFNVRRGRVEVVRFMCHASHPLAGASGLSIRDLEGYEWVVQAPLMPMRQAVEDAFVNAQVPLPQEIVNTTSLLVMIAYLNSTDAIAPTSREVVDLLAGRQDVSELSTIDLDEPIILHAYHLISLKNHTLNPLAIKLRDLVFAALSG
tara:strand:- start:922 stop:1848 length:927 start_codon:yes stop_codon:yes gene_type:complete